MDHSPAGYNQAVGECADPLYYHWTSALLSGGGNALARMPHWPYTAKPVLLTSKAMFTSCRVIPGPSVKCQLGKLDFGLCAILSWSCFDGKVIFHGSVGAALGGMLSCMYLSSCCVTRQSACRPACRAGPPLQHHSAPTELPAYLFLAGTRLNAEPFSASSRKKSPSIQTNERIYITKHDFSKV